jgi:hypothetical protein
MVKLKKSRKYFFRDFLYTFADRLLLATLQAACSVADTA